jgi:hypothetical protein
MTAPASASASAAAPAPAAPAASTSASVSVSASASAAAAATAAAAAALLGPVRNIRPPTGGVFCRVRVIFRGAVSLRFDAPNFSWQLLVTA